MREQVCIILNERESIKHNLVASLLEQLKKISITASRIEISENIIEIVCLKCPKILILDYLLGDYTTGLDIVYAINKLPEEKRPLIFFLTDEPSVQVAVEAMLLGTKNYFQLDRNDSLPKLIDEIKVCLQTSKKEKCKLPSKHTSLDSLIFQSSSSRQLLSAIKTEIKNRASSIILHGTCGSGLSALACAIHNDIFPENFVRNIDLRIFDSKIDFITGFPTSSSNVCLSIKNVSFTIEHAESDNGEILDHFADYLKNGPGKQKENITIITTSDQKTALNWKKLTNSAIINIPELADRTEDIAPLIFSFQHAAEEITGSKIKKVSADLIQKIAHFNWPGNIQQLKSVFINSAIESLDSEEDMSSIIERNKSKWELYNIAESYLKIEALHASKTFEIADHSYRIAAAKLGCSVSELHNILTSGGKNAD